MGEAMPGPKKGVRLHDRHREAIDVGKCLKLLHSIVETGLTPDGKEPTPAQLVSAKELLSKSLPALQAQEITSNVEHNYVINAPAEFDAKAWQEKADALKTPANKLN